MRANMALTVRILPSGREFTVAGRETILEAGLRSGLSLRYRCSNGSCGECKARIVSGQVRQVRLHDFVLNAVEKAAGDVLLCCTGADSDLVIEVREIGGADEVARQEVRARVSAIERIGGDLIVLRLRTPRSQALQFLAGQYVSLTLPGLLPRYRSIASCPCSGNQLEFHVRRIPGDAFCEYVFTQLKTSQTVQIDGPEGSLTLDRESTRPIVFFAYDTGFAPIKSVVEYAISLEGEQPMALYWMALADGEHYLDNLCRSWADALENFSYTALTSIAGPPAAEREWSEYAALEQVLAEHQDLSAYDVYFAGPRGLVSTARRLFMAQGLPSERFFAETLRHF
ncbi:MAG: 2Fe-2S iron-sulfur cluster-binding protein [Gammaproteobacteria bacterium]|nr:2Fe-2S iron-sulfur cluster-binding protein [Gammaproteobacteria bacterium]